MSVLSAGGFFSPGILAFHATVAEGDAAAAITWARRPRRRFLELLQCVPQRSARIAIIQQHLVEELRSDYSDGPMKQVSVTPGQVPPPPPLERMHQCYVEDERRQPLHFRVSVRTEGFEAADVLLGDMALVQEAPNLVQLLNAVTFLSRHTLAILADMITVAATAESLVSAGATTDAAEVAHRNLRLQDC
jgi:hypothetical protein